MKVLKKIHHKPELYEQTRGGIVKKLPVTATVALGWTLRDSESFLRPPITCLWRGREKLLQTNPLYESHMGMERDKSLNPVTTENAKDSDNINVPSSVHF